MSVEKDIYIGLYVDIDKYVEDPYEGAFVPYIEGHKELKFDMVYDGMSGNYMYFGKTYGKLEEYGDNEKVVIKNNIEKDKEKIFEELEKLGISLEEDDAIEHIVFEHCY